MAKIAVERTIGKTKKAVLGGLIGYNTEKMGKKKYKRFAISLREGDTAGNRGTYPSRAGMGSLFR